MLFYLWHQLRCFCFHTEIAIRREKKLCVNRIFEKYPRWKSLMGNNNNRCVCLQFSSSRQYLVWKKLLRLFRLSLYTTSYFAILLKYREFFNKNYYFSYIFSDRKAAFNNFLCNLYVYTLDINPNSDYNKIIRIRIEMESWYNAIK